MSDLTGYIQIFETKLAKMKDKLKQELQKSKKDRSRKIIKDLVSDCRKLKKLLQGKRNKCPHCGHEL